ncbi:MAG: porin family protein [Legionellaceae bacterium]
MFEKKHAGLLLMTSLTVVSASGLASPLMDLSKLNLPFVASLSLGPVWESAGDTQTFYLTPSIEKTYAAQHVSHALLDGEIFFGLQRPLREKLEGQLGLAVATTSQAKLSGYVWDDAQAQFNNYVYSYQVNHTHVAIKGKLLADRGYVVTPWLSGSLGVGFNQAHAYSNTPLIPEAVVMPNFTNNTTTAFTYTVGAGFQRHLNQHWQAGVGYEFADWGKSQLNRAPEQTLNEGLSLSHLYTNGFLFNLTYQA